MAYAQSYAKAGLEMTDEREIETQCLYILSNLQGWRGAEARECKAILKAIAHQ